MKYLTGLAASIFLLSGCATTDKQSALDCNLGDWNAFGKAAAESGREVRIIDKYKNGCENFDESALDDYLDGYSRGLITFCTYDQGYEHGLNSVPPSEICPYEIQEHYVRGYNDGHRIYEDRIEEIDRLRRESEYKSDHQPQNPSGSGSNPENPTDAYDGSF